MDKPKWVGFSNGESYLIYKLGKEENTGWCYVDGYTGLVDCLFERIEKIRSDRKCYDCGEVLQIVRPGKYQCNNCQ